MTAEPLSNTVLTYFCSWLNVLTIQLILKRAAYLLRWYLKYVAYSHCVIYSWPGVQGSGPRSRVRGDS